MATEILRPTAAGDLTDAGYTAFGAATHWDCMDEAVADDDTTRLTSSGSGGTKEDCYNITNTALTTETITSVDVLIRSERTGGGGSAQAGVRLSGTDSLGASHAVTGAYVDYIDTGLARPGGGSWAVSDLNALQVCALCGG